MLRSFPLPEDDRLITTWDCGEDAALWTIDDRRLGILTLDFITPVVDDPRQWGRIAAANAISDVFAMGGRPFIALNIVAFPVKALSLGTLKEVMKGGHEAVSEAGAFLAGGHSVEDQEPKYGLCVFGEVEREALWRVSGARPGDQLLLTKPLGSGILTTAVKADMLDNPRWADEAARWMGKLNCLPLDMPLDLRRTIHACTDVTGFGLVGHCLDMLSAGDVDLLLDVSSLPIMGGVLELAAMGLVPAGAYRNRDLYGEQVTGLNFAEERIDVLFDPQTSGGLLLATPPDAVDRVMDLARNSGCGECTLIGRFEQGDGALRVTEGM